MPLATAREANAHNNAEHQELRLARWRDVRDSVWSLVGAHLDGSQRVLVVGAGNGDDLPLQRIAAACSELVLVDIDPDALARAGARAEGAAARVRSVELDVTDGAADRVLTRAGQSWWRTPVHIAPPVDAIAGGGFDLVVGDMLYTQLLHPGLIALGLTQPEQRRCMRRYDATLRDALVRRLHASTGVHGLVLHLHDVACWAPEHPQPVDLAAALDAPEQMLAQLRRHDRCDPAVALQQLGIEPITTSWWQWAFEPRTSYLVRAVLARGAFDVNRNGYFG